MELAHELGDDPFGSAVPDRGDRLERWGNLGDP
jgi:hypothetical protein